MSSTFFSFLFFFFLIFWSQENREFFDRTRHLLCRVIETESFSPPSSLLFELSSLFLILSSFLSKVCSGRKALFLTD